MRQKFNMITLGVADLERAINFYETGLGWKRAIPEMEGIAFFQLGGILLSLYPLSAMAADANISADGSGFSGISISYNAKSEQEVDEVLKEVAGLGATIVKPAEKAFWGGYSGYFKDLDGHLMEVAHNPFWKLDANDNVVL